MCTLFLSSPASRSPAIQLGSVGGTVCPMANCFQALKQFPEFAVVVVNAAQRLIRLLRLPKFPLAVVDRRKRPTLRVLRLAPQVWLRRQMNNRLTSRGE